MRPERLDFMLESFDGAREVRLHTGIFLMEPGRVRLLDKADDVRSASAPGRNPNALPW